MIALIVLAIEKLSEFITALIRGSHPNHAPTLVSHNLVQRVLSDVNGAIGLVFVLHDIQIHTLIYFILVCLEKWRLHLQWINRELNQPFSLLLPRLLILFMNVLCHFPNP